MASAPVSIMDAMELASARPSGRQLTVAGLFAGIGGIELGLHQAGFRTEMLFEIDDAAVAVLDRSSER
jgi:C-5 cytosine-specific DNA methylase